nr:MAG TPA: hypothetical protein [Caudoviricetes sp.]
MFTYSPQPIETYSSFFIYIFSILMPIPTHCLTNWILM